MGILRQHVDEKTEHANVVRDGVQRLRLLFRAAATGRQRAHLALHIQRRLHCLVLVEDRQRTLHLVQHGIDLAQRRAPRGVQVILVEHLLDLAQAALHFARQHGHRRILPERMRQRVLPWRGVKQRGAPRQRQQARADQRGVRVEVTRQVAQLAQALLDKQQRAGHLDAELVAASGKRRHERIAGGAHHVAQQLRQRRRLQLAAGTGQRGQRRIKVRFERRVAVARQPLPGRLGLGQRRIRRLQRHSVGAMITAACVIGRHHAGQAKGVLQQLRCGVRRGRGGDEEQCVAQHRLG